MTAIAATTVTEGTIDEMIDVRVIGIIGIVTMVGIDAVMKTTVGVGATVEIHKGTHGTTADGGSTKNVQALRIVDHQPLQGPFPCLSGIAKRLAGMSLLRVTSNTRPFRQSKLVSRLLLRPQAGHLRLRRPLQPSWCQSKPWSSNYRVWCPSSRGRWPHQQHEPRSPVSSTLPRKHHANGG